MKKVIVLGSLVTILFTACSKEKNNTECIRGKIIYKGLSCHQKWGVQLLSGPKIGESYNEYDNVIEVYNIPDDIYLKYINTGVDDLIEFKIRNSKTSDFKEYNNCHTKEAVYDVSSVKKAFVSLCN